MALMGKGVAAIWHDITPESEADYHHWHCHEHIPERVGIPGFLRGRRYGRTSGSPRFFHFYETEDLATLTSPEYLARLDNPTPWTSRVVPNFRNNNRSLCEVVCSVGQGGGAAILTIRMDTQPGAAADLEHGLCNTLLPQLVAQSGIVGAHLLRGDEAASNTQTEEKAMRDRPDDVAAWVLFVEALMPSVLEPLVTTCLSDSTLATHGAMSPDVGIYNFHFSLSAEELR
jgi:hypothetical protein